MLGASERSRPQKPTLLDDYTGIIDDLLSQGVSNSSVCFDCLKEAGYTGGFTTVKTYISKHSTCYCLVLHSLRLSLLIRVLVSGNHLP